MQMLLYGLLAVANFVSLVHAQGFAEEFTVDQCCSDKSPVCLCGSCYDTETAKLIRCRPPPGWDGDCCPDNDPPVEVAECCSEEAPTCACGSCSADPAAPTLCLPPPDWDGDCCPDNDPPAVEVAECCSEDAPTCACGFCSADPDAPKFCKPAPGWDGDCCPFEPDEACKQEAGVVGLCKAAFLRWTFNADLMICEQFTYGGCGGNENNFETEEECANACFANPLPEPVAECCTEDKPLCLCATPTQTGFCGDLETQARVLCPIAERDSCCAAAPTPAPAAEVDECCTPDAPACVCATLDSPGRCVTEDTALQIKWPAVLGGTCCTPPPPPPPPPPTPVDECCSVEAPVCACGSRCVTPEEAATLRCVQTADDDTCCDLDNLPDTDQEEESGGFLRSFLKWFKRPK